MVSSYLVLLAAVALCLFPVYADVVDHVDSVVYTAQPVSPPISPSYIGFSLEHDMATTWTGLSHTRPSFINLIHQLHPTRGPHSGTTFRIGGNSADYALYTGGSSLPANLSTGFAFTYAITDADIQALAVGVGAVEGELIFGLNFRYPNASLYAVPHLQAIQRLVGWKQGSPLRGIEIGNEPDLSDSTHTRDTNPTYKRRDSSLTHSPSVASVSQVRRERQQRRGLRCGRLLQGLRELHGAVTRGSAGAAVTFCAGRGLLLQRGVAGGVGRLRDAVHRRAVPRRSTPLPGTRHTRDRRMPSHSS